MSLSIGQLPNEALIEDNVDDDVIVDIMITNVISWGRCYSSALKGLSVMSVAISN